MARIVNDSKVTSWSFMRVIIILAQFTTKAASIGDMRFLTKTV